MGGLQILLQNRRRIHLHSRHAHLQTRPCPAEAGHVLLVGRRASLQNRISGDLSAETIVHTVDGTFLRIHQPKDNASSGWS